MVHDPKNRKDFVLPHGGGHFFVQQLSEYNTNYIQVGQEFRFGDDALEIEEKLTVHREDLPDFLDKVADYHELPRYTDLLNIVEDVKDLVKELRRMDRREDWAFTQKLMEILEEHSG